MVKNRFPRPQQPEQPQEPQPIVFQKWSGLKNTVTEERLGPDDLLNALNVDLDDVGQPHRRRGRSLVLSGDIGSLFTSAENILYIVKDGSLGIINPDFSFVPLQSNFSLNWDPIAYVQVGPKIYFSGSNQAGIIDQPSRSVSPWVGPNLGGTPVTDPQFPAVPSPNFWYSPVVNPTKTLAPIKGKLLGPPPLATTLAYWNGRIYMGHDNLVWFTELWNYLYIDKTKNFWQFEAPITMIAAVTDGLYVGTEEGCWFVSGLAISPKRVRVLDFPVIRGSAVEVPGELANPAQVPLLNQQPVKVSLLFLTEAGYCGGQDGGVCYNYTENRFIFPDVMNAAAMFRRQDGTNHYVVTANSGGTPSSTSRIGDYVDATIRRAGTWDERVDCVHFGDELSVTIIPA